MPLLSIIIPTKDRPAILQRTVDALLKALEGTAAEVIIVNDSASPAVINAAQKDLVRLVNNRGKGAATARNYGVSLAKADLLLFLDDDIIVTRDNIRRTLELHRQYPRACFNFYWFFPPDLIEKLPHSKFGRYLLLNLIFSNSSRVAGGRLSSTSGLIPGQGAASYYLSITKQDFLETGGYDVTIPFAGVEDIILSKKFRMLGIETYLSPSDFVFHNEADRLGLKEAMGRYMREGATRRAACQAGYPDHVLRLPAPKKALYALLLPCKHMIRRIADGLPDNLWFDPLYFRLVRLLLGMSSLEGFRQNNP